MMDEDDDDDEDDEDDEEFWQTLSRRNKQSIPPIANRVISDTAEYGCYLFDHACKPLLADFMKKVETNIIGKNFNEGKDTGVDNKTLIAVNEIIRFHPIEIIGAELRQAMTDMKVISTVA